MDLQELEKYRPISRGGLKILLGTVATLVLAANGMLLGVFMYKWIPNLPGDLEILPGVLFAMASSMGVLIYATSGSRRKWIEDYLRRNVRGYNAWFWRDKKQKIQISFTRRGKKGDEDSSPLPLPVIKVPLGGWFNSWGCVYRRWFNEVGRAQGWKVRFPSDPWRNALSPHVTLVDGENHSITPDIGTALDFCEYHFTGDRMCEWLLQVDVMLEEIKRFSRERDEAKKQSSDLGSALTAMRCQRDYALVAMDKAIVAINATSRFSKSKEARRIREEMIRDLFVAAPADSPLRARYEQAESQSAAVAEAREGG